MYYIVDRIEENFAVCENLETQEIRNITLNKLPTGIKPGDVIKQENEIYLLDFDETEKRKEIIHKKTKGLWI